MGDFDPVRVTPRPSGELRVIALHDSPRVVVELEVPSRVVEAEIDAAARTAVMLLQRTPSLLGRYNLGDHALSEKQIEGLAEGIVLVEAAARLWKRWNVQFGDDVLVAPLTPENIARLLEDIGIRIVWSQYYSSFRSLDFSEGNVSASSPDTSSDGGAPTAADASSSTGPVAEGSPEAPASSASEPNNPPEPQTD